MNSAELKRFDSRVIPGTRVLVENLGWRVVKTVCITRKLIKIEGLVGSFQRGHVLKFSNTKKLVKEE